MNRTTGRFGGAALLAALMVGMSAVSACGRVGYLEQPAPLFGERAKEQYRAQRAADAEASRQRTIATRQPGEVERESANPSSGDNTPPIGSNPPTGNAPLDPNAPLGSRGTSPQSDASQPSPTDNAPLTKRDVQSPEQKLTPLSSSPLPGIPSDPRGAQPSLTPPN